MVLQRETEIKAVVKYKFVPKKNAKVLASLSKYFVETLELVLNIQT